MTEFDDVTEMTSLLSFLFYYVIINLQDHKLVKQLQITKTY